MPSPIAPFLALALAFAASGGQSAPDDPVEQTRAQLVRDRRELVAKIEDPAWMQDQSRATLVRLQLERNWKLCAANEAFVLAKASEKPARQLAETALSTCRVWEQALVLALRNGAYPYLDSYTAISREDMVSAAALASRDAALTRILEWRGMATGSAQASRSSPPPDAKRDSTLPAGSFTSQRAFAEPPAPAPQTTTNPPDALPGEDQAVITVVGERSHVCRVRLADHTLTESELAKIAKRWAASGTALRVIRPAGADYHCLTRIVTHLGEYGVRLFEFVDP